MGEEKYRKSFLFNIFPALQGEDVTLSSEMGLSPAFWFLSEVLPFSDRACVEGLAAYRDGRSDVKEETVWGKAAL